MDQATIERCYEEAEAEVTNAQSNYFYVQKRPPTPKMFDDLRLAEAWLRGAKHGDVRVDKPMAV